MFLALSAGYYFATEGFEVNYSGEFANLFKDVNLLFNVHYNSPNFAVNFFGYGNETSNPEADDDDGLDEGLELTINSILNR